MGAPRPIFLFPTSSTTNNAPAIAGGLIGGMAVLGVAGGIVGVIEANLHRTIKSTPPPERLFVQHDQIKAHSTMLPAILMLFFVASLVLAACGVLAKIRKNRCAANYSRIDARALSFQ